MEDNSAQNINVEPQSVAPSTPPAPEPKKSFLKWIVAIIVAAILIIIAGASYLLYQNQVPKQVACTAEAKICPDGSSVGRTGPTCEFAACPTPNPASNAANATATWKTYANSEYIFKYPPEWKMEIDNQGGVSLIPPENKPDNFYGSVTVTKTENFNKNNLGNYVENFEVNSTKGYRVSLPSGQNPAQEGFEVYKNGDRYQIWLFYLNKNYVDVFNNLLSTFKFTDASPTPNPITNNWNKYSDLKYNFSFKLPTDWSTQIKDYPENSQRLINIIKNSSPSVISLSFTISDNWNNTGDAQYLPKNIIVGGTEALKVDPPKPEEKQLERYQTNVYFEQGGYVYFFACTHNWNKDYINTCNNILSTVHFTP